MGGAVSYEQGTPVASLRRGEGTHSSHVGIIDSKGPYLAQLPTWAAPKQRHHRDETQLFHYFVVSLSRSGPRDLSLHVRTYGERSYTRPVRWSSAHMHWYTRLSTGQFLEAHSKPCPRLLQPCGCQSWFDQFASPSVYALGGFDQRWRGFNAFTT